MNESEVLIPSGAVELSGTYSAPEGDGGPHVAILMIAGSGPLDRDGNHKRLPLAVSKDLSDVFVARGFSTLRYDKRGVGESGGDYMTAGFHDELDDARAALSWLADRDDVFSVIPVGHSAGSLHAAELAAEGLASGGAVLLAHTVKTGRETLVWQAKEIGETVPAWIKKVMALFGTSIEKQQGKALTKIASSEADVVRIQGQRTNGKWMREFLTYDPRSALERVATPVLALTGSKDVQVDPGDIGHISEILGSVGVARLVDDVDHILRHEPAATSNPKYYKRQIRKPIDSAVTAAIMEWIEAR